MATFMGAWKMTYASRCPVEAQAFAIRYLAADNYGTFARPAFECGDVQWVFWPAARVKGATASRFGKEGGHAQLHFVEHLVKPAGALHRHTYEQHHAILHRGLAPHDAFMHTRVTLEAHSLAPLLSTLTQDGVPYLLLENPHGTFSLFVEAPTANLIEVVGPAPLVLPDQVKAPQAWERCGKIQQPRWMASKATRAHSTTRGAASTSIFRIKRFVFASTNPGRSAVFVARYLNGNLTHESAAEIGSGACFNSASVRWTEEDSTIFEMTWIFNNATVRGGLIPLAEEERYLAQLHGNLSTASPLNWNHFMDYHGGILFESCGPLLGRLRADGVPFSRARHGCDNAGHTYTNPKSPDSCLSIFVRDDAGIVYEFMCHSFSADDVHDVFPWDMCGEPSASFSTHVGEVPAPLSLNGLPNDVVSREEDRRWPEHVHVAAPTNSTYTRYIDSPRASGLLPSDGVVVDINARGSLAVCRWLNTSSALRFKCMPDSAALAADKRRGDHVALSSRHPFCGVSDYSVSARHWTRHVLRYTNLLAPGGLLFLKWDWELKGGGSGSALTKEVVAWRSVRAVLSAHYFHPIREHLALRGMCSHNARLLRELHRSAAAQREHSTTESPSVNCAITYSTWELSTMHDAGKPAGSRPCSVVRRWV